MNNKKNIILLWIAGAFIFTACNNSTPAGQSDEHREEHAAGGDIARLTARQQQAIGLRLGHIEHRHLSTSVTVTGRLELPPQYHAVVSTFMGGNVKRINVIEGDYVKEGEVLAWLEHLDYIELQQNFQQLVSSLAYLREEFQRKETLYENEVSSAKAYQDAAARYKSAMARYRGMKKKLQLLGLNPEAVENGKISAAIAVRSPINGYVKAINVSTGQYAATQAEMFEITNNEHVHADFMVYEKDAHKVKKGQHIRFKVANMPEKVLQAEVFSVGKTVEEDPRAVHVHADIITPEAELIPGMFINGRLQVDSITQPALPEEAIVHEGERYYIFVKRPERPNGDGTETGLATFQKVEITTGVSDQGFTAVSLLQPLPDSALVVTKGAYYLLAEMNKEQNEHSH